MEVAVVAVVAVAVAARHLPVLELRQSLLRLAQLALPLFEQSVGRLLLRAEHALRLAHRRVPLRGEEGGAGCEI